MEVLAARYLAQADFEPNFEVRFDIISMMVVGENMRGLKTSWSDETSDNRFDEATRERNEPQKTLKEER